MSIALSSIFALTISSVTCVFGDVATFEDSSFLFVSLVTVFSAITFAASRGKPAATSLAVSVCIFSCCSIASALVLGTFVAAGAGAGAKSISPVSGSTCPPNCGCVSSGVPTALVAFSPGCSISCLSAASFCNTVGTIGCCLAGI